ncbi:hypothetical protein SAY87_007845 [Trapa incisa]|uniref:Uncharacterized protein n=1 Tax=Trapa incisa TaxID=236973 RepID=A0AAN7QG16_9MYRT|nr:hypothetical protein SAY87_007845 [Trapa incisa]
MLMSTVEVIQPLSDAGTSMEKKTKSKSRSDGLAKLDYINKAKTDSVGPEPVEKAREDPD